MKINLISSIQIYVLVALVTCPLKAVQEQELIAILQSSAGVAEKCAACQQLRIHGTVKSIPALTDLLGTERVGHAARYALEGMPYPEAVAALRDALSKTSGRIKAGIIDSLGWRRDAAAVPLLIPLLSDGDETVAVASASALGRIGSPDAIDALKTAIENANPEVRLVVLEALLHCAEKRLRAGDDSGAAAIYGDLLDAEVPSMIRTPALRALVLPGDKCRPELIVQILGGADKEQQEFALKLVRETKDTQLITTCLKQWRSLPSLGQLAVFDAHLQFGKETLTTVRTASQSPHPEVRVAAWRALANLSETGMIPALVHAAAEGEPMERKAAREALTRIRGPGVHKALLACLNHAETKEKVELLGALGKRGDPTFTPTLLQYAKATEKNIRLAALESLRRLAVTDTLLPLFDLAVNAKSASDRNAVLKALTAVCQANPDKGRISRQVITAFNCLPAAQRRFMLPLMAEIATHDALIEVQKATQNSDSQIVREAIRVLTQWPNANPARHLFEIARTHSDPSLRTLALRGGVIVAGREPDPVACLALLREALLLPGRVEEKKLALSQLSRIPKAEAIELALPYLNDPELINEAGLAAISIAESLAKANPQLADEIAREVLKYCKTPTIIKTAWALRIKPAAKGPFIQNWLVCGPYRKKGAVGANAVFNLAFGPEKPNETVNWIAAPVGDTVNLAGLFPNQSNCVAYLKTEIIASESTDAILFMGSDDGIKAWLNGAIVHSNNVDRGRVVDQDMAPIKLKKGGNELMLKITQGGGGWSACARIVGPDGRPIKGLRIKSKED